MSYWMRRSAYTNGRPFKPGLAITDRAFPMANSTQGDSKEEPAVSSFLTVACCSDDEWALSCSPEDKDPTDTSLIENWIDA